ncbi:MAG: sialate O-acetylesterase [Methylacidiphilales bacterium]|nr:sialate O-acetylesterase [Candidatus Methylacidiphilales bacterium]
MRNFFPAVPVFRAVILSTVFGLGLPGLLSADVTLPAIFSTHMVLQKSTNAPVWGKALPGEQVTVQLDQANAEAVADGDGKWKVDLNLLSEGTGPFQLIVQGNNKLTVDDVLIGEVWLCGGQSNMGLEVSKTMGADGEVASSANPQLRLFQVVLSPSGDSQGQWLVAGPDTTANFTAVGYYFGKALQKTLHVPVGLISASYGGSAIETWLSPQGLEQAPEIKAAAAPLIADTLSYPQRLNDFYALCQPWLTKYDRVDTPSLDSTIFTDPQASTTDWETVTLPGSVSPTGFSGEGAIWIRRTVTIPPKLAGNYLPLHLGTIHDFDTVYWNGVKVGETSPETTTSINDEASPTNDRRYNVPGNLVKEGPATIAIRIFSPAGHAGIDGKNLNAGFGDIDLRGEWLAKVEFQFTSSLDSQALAEYPHQPPTPVGPRFIVGALYNGIIHPIVPYAIRGVIWYQGEANVGRAFQYRTTFPLLIRDWRQQWNEGDFPFYFCQLANLGSKDKTPRESSWAEMRESQTATLSVPATGEAVLFDIGEQDDVHFRDKKDVGDRLSFLALANTYAQKVPFSGPVYDSMQVVGPQIRVYFKFTDGGLVAKPLPATYQPKSSLPQTVPLVLNSPQSELQGFSICGADRHWVWADAKIVGDDVLVWSDQIAVPVAVRYGWADNPTVNLYNGAGFPAAPFRTDDFPLTTQNKQY